jgi:hypothetical protein
MEKLLFLYLKSLFRDLGKTEGDGFETIYRQGLQQAMKSEGDVQSLPPETWKRAFDRAYAEVQGLTK